MDINNAFKSACKVILGEEIGELSGYANWLYEKNGPRIVKKSYLSGSDVVFAAEEYQVVSQAARLDEFDMSKQYAPISINDLKDIDSLISAISQRAVFCGNIVLGNSSNVEQSTVITDSNHILHSERAAFCKYVAYSTRGSYSENIYGCKGFGPAKYCIKAKGAWDVTRCFNSTKIDFSSDIYYSHGLTNCQDCFFCFNLKGKRNMIGNYQLGKGKYLEIKSALLGQIRDELEKNKRLPTLIDALRDVEADYSLLKNTMKLYRNKMHSDEKKDKSKIESAFSLTSKLVLSKSLEPIDSYSNYLSKNSGMRIVRSKSCISDSPVLLPDFADFADYPANRLLTQQEADFCGEHMALTEVESLSLGNFSSFISRIAFFSPYWNTGKVHNNIDSPLNIDSSDCYNGVLFMKSKLCSFCEMSRNCENIFGCREARHAQFCMKSYFSTKITRCFEVDNCNSCSDCYFCHNIENCTECMFCFNVKSMRYAIGNVEYPKEEYMQIKKKLLSGMVLELEKNKTLELGIFNIGCKK